MDKKTIESGMQALSLIDQNIEKAFKALGPPPPRIRPRGFETFLSIIVSQQLSTKVATVIMARVVALMQNVTAGGLMVIADQDLRDAGLSWRKIEYVKGLAAAIVDGSFNVDELDSLSDEDAIKAITKLRGFGRWSAEIYLMFSLQRQDIFPADDLGILVALGQLKGLADKPTPKQAREMVSHWSPWRSIGALFLWQYYHKPDSVKK
ncbi:MAG: DNA-3-methyladenine glycosylase II [Psychromonas sp.]|jgi:DNA-3-methyladenine glycosylase II|uniref:DNA-3-methyladenine glycosylase family protein n=1 Tax=Psychromonas sp. TaxID=1884585 RepID=UPI0039E3FC5A